MKKIFFHLFIISFAGIIVFISCKKEYSCVSCGNNSPSGTNKPPISVAGPDQIITLPTDSVLLDGNASSDPDGSMINYKWSAIASFLSGSVPTIQDTITKQTEVTNLRLGIYRFEL